MISLTSHAKTQVSRVAPTIIALWLAGVGAISAGEAQAAPTNAVGINTHVPTADQLDAAQDLGVGWIRIDVNWVTIQAGASKPAESSWGQIDAVVDGALKRGLKVFATVAYAPQWANGSTDHGVVSAPGHYQAFCQEAAARYQGKVTHWGLWNEPNLSGFFKGSRQEWIDRILVGGTRGFRAGCPGCKVVGPELAGLGDYDDWMKDALDGMKAAGEAFDVLSWHNYGNFKEIKTGWKCWDTHLFKHLMEEQRECLGIDVGTPPMRPLLENKGVGHLPVWITETGYKAPVDDAGKAATQATYYRRVLEEQLERPWWTNTFFYELVDDNSPTVGKFGVVRRPDGVTAYPGAYQHKPAWYLLQTALAEQPAFGGTGSDCSDGLDNDGDGKIDFGDDSQCTAANDPSETSTNPPVPPPPAADAGAGAGNDSGASPRHDAGVWTADSAPHGGGNTGYPDAGLGSSPPGLSVPADGGCSVASVGRGPASCAFGLVALLGLLMVRAGRRRRRAR